MHMLVMKIQQIIQCAVYKNHTHFYDNLMELYLANLHLKSHHQAFYFHHYLHYILQLIYQLTFLYIYSFYSLKILLCHIIYNTYTHNY